MVDEQVAAHEEAVTAFRDYFKDGETPAIKAFAATTLPTLEHHLEIIKALDAKVTPPKS